MLTITVAEDAYTPYRCFCIGRNYVDHVAELGNAVPDAPVIFMKPASSLLPPDAAAIRLPVDGDLHYEAELVILIGQTGGSIAPARARDYIAALGLGLDLTRRELQTDLKAKGLPWERAKAFDHSAPIGHFVRLTDELDLATLNFTCTINGEIRQTGATEKMIFPVAELIAQISRPWRLQRGDLIFTGTPAGVGALHSGDEIALAGDWCEPVSWRVAAGANQPPA